MLIPQILIYTYDLFLKKVASCRCADYAVPTVGAAEGPAVGEQQQQQHPAAVSGSALGQRELQAREKLFAERLTYDEFAAQYDALASDPAVKTVENNGMLIINRK